MGTKTHAISRDEMARYLRVLASATGPMLVHAAVCAAVIGTGARIGEVLALRDRDLFSRDGVPLPDVSRGLEKKNRKEAGQEETSEEEEARRKKRAKRLSVAFPWKYLGGPVIRWREVARKSFLLQPDQMIFSVRNNGEPLNQRSARRVQWRFLEMAGISPRGVAFHGLRKSFLREVYYERRRNGDDMMTALRHVQKLAGHARFETTLLYLMDEIEGNHRETIEGIFEGLS